MNEKKEWSKKEHFRIKGSGINEKPKVENKYLKAYRQKLLREEEEGGGSSAAAARKEKSRRLSIQVGSVGR